MYLVRWGFIGLLALPAAEVLAFVLVASLTGWLAATILLIATSVIGLTLLRRFGAADLSRLRAAFAADGIAAIHLDTPGMATLLGGILLVFPGFMTDLAGAALLVPTIRRWVRVKFAKAARDRRRSQRDRRVIDLEPGEWHQIQDQRRSRKSASYNRRGVKRNV
jgi:UPF0716 protein FxsA